MQPKKSPARGANERIQILSQAISRGMRTYNTCRNTGNAQVNGLIAWERTATSKTMAHIFRLAMTPSSAGVHQWYVFLATDHPITECPDSSKARNMRQSKNLPITNCSIPQLPRSPPFCNVASTPKMRRLSHHPMSSISALGESSSRWRSLLPAMDTLQLSLPAHRLVQHTTSVARHYYPRTAWLALTCR